MQASYGAPTDRYPHGVLGDDLEWGSLQVICGGSRHSVDLPEALVERLRHYCLTYKMVPGEDTPTVAIDRIYGATQARAVVTASIEDYRDRYGEG